ncbi:hypothetical protein [Desulfoscipio gibsoniae]|uniref:hypothetical protein n=1 Tax=Desulfoscipio gibsoniae TaxID=102134 RepID=UPI00031E068F
MLDQIDIAVNGPTLDEAIEELIRELKTYAEDYRDNMSLFLNAPNRKGHFPYILRVWLCDNTRKLNHFWRFKYAPKIWSPEKVLR